ncbi:hypothetical protein N7505_007494, partial [Penicillium chrysogenum]
LPKRMIPDLTSTSATTAQVAKATQHGVYALLENIQASERTIGRQLLSVEKRLERITSEVEGTYSCDIKLSCKVHIHLRAAISNTQDTCERFLGTFKEWKYHSSSLYLHESDYGNFDIFEVTELRLFSESLQMLEYTILMAEENSVLLDEVYTKSSFRRGVDLNNIQREGIILSSDRHESEETRTTGRTIGTQTHHL